ncbi:PKD domain-containing protein, partial [Chloroflexota bacterium]
YQYYLWDFGDGDTSTDMDPTHVFDEGGTHNVSLTVTDYDTPTESHTKIKPVEVLYSPAVTASNDGPACVGGDVQFTGGASLGTAPYIWSWSGPDGFSSSDQSPLLTGVTVAKAGTYTLTVTDDNGCTGSNTTTVVVQDYTDLSLTKTVDESAPDEGDTVKYTVTLINSGPCAAGGLVVTDSLPSGLTYSGDTPSQGSYDSGTGEWTVGTVAYGASATLSISATVDSGTATQTITNTAELTASDRSDPDSTPNNNVPAEDDQDSADLTVKGADLEVSKTVDDSFPNEGDTVTYTITLTNNGPDTATNIVITDSLPTGVTYQSDTPSQGTYDSGSGAWSVGTLANGASATLTISATVDPGTAGQTITNTASVTSVDQGDQTPANNSDSAALTVQAADLEVLKTVNNPIPNEGDTITYIITLVNNGPDTATNIVLTDSLPSGVTYQSNTPSQGTYDNGSGAWSVGSLANSASATLDISATIDAGTAGQTIINTASVTSVDQADTVPANNSDSASLIVQASDLAVTKTVDDSFPNEGDTITYTITLTNNGPDPATNIVITDSLPSGVTYQSDTPSHGTYDSGSGQWSVGSLANGGSATLDISATVDAGTATQTITNNASITGMDQTDLVPANNFDSAALTVQGADLQVTKTVDDSAPNEGDTITYTITLTNNGPDTATNIIVTDLLPSGATYVSDTPDQGTYSDSTGAWDVGSLANGFSIDLIITATIDSDTAGQTITNTASVTGVDQGDQTPGNNSDSAALTVQAADLAILKTVDDPTPNEGDTVTYTITLTNNGPDDATNIVVTDSLPSGVTYVSDSPDQGTYSDSTGAWDIGSLANGISIDLIITVTIDSDTAGQTITNTASVTSVDQGDQTPANNSDSAALTVQAADLAVSKVVNDPSPNEGDTITSTITLTNNGPDTADNIILTDILPAGVTYVSDSPDQGTYSDATGAWDVGSLANSISIDLDITATVDPGTAGQTITNTASVTSVDQGDPTPGNNSDSAALIVQSADLAVTKTVNDPAPNEGDTITYTITLTNNGPDSATNIIVTDLLPSGVTYVSDAPDQGTYNNATGVWDVGSLANGASVDLIITATVDSGTAAQTITNTASVTSVDQGDPTPGNNSDSAAFTVQGADLEVTKTVDDPNPNEGDTITYTITLDNNGPDTATNIIITDLLPSGVTYVSDSPDQGTYSDSTGAWDVGSLANGISIDLDITATVDASTATQTITNTASVSSVDQADSVPANNSDSAALTVQAADLAVTKTVDDSHPNEGDTVTYTITLTNNGPDTATNIVISDLLPAGVTYSSHTPSQGTYDSGSGAWPVGSLANGASATLYISASVDTGTAAQTITNTASVSSVDQADPTPANNSDSAALTVQGADLQVIKTVNNPAPNEGDTITYTITLTNNGPDTATNIIISDLLPSGVTYSSHTPSQGTYDSGSGAWSVGSLANGASATLTISATVDSGTAGQTITNTASVSSVDQADSTTANNSDSAALIVQAADLAVTKTVNDPSPNEGDTITYTITLTNNGPDTA